MDTHHHKSLARLKPRLSTIYCSQGRAVLATNLDGVIGDFPRHGLFVGETRLLSRYRYLVDGKPPQTVAVSNVEQHSGLGYYISPAPGVQWKPDTGSGEMEESSEETIELKVSRTVGLGVHEDIDITNFTQQAAKFTFEIEIDADFADQAEIFRRKQRGKLTRHWRRISSRQAELAYDYHASHRYSHQGNRGVAHLHRSLIVRIEKASSQASFHGSRLRFYVSIKGHESWHVCLKLIPAFDGERMPPLYGCHPWLIKRFVDPQAEFLFVEEKDLLEQSKQHDAIPFDAPKIDAIKLNHRGSRCSFEAILEDYAVTDPDLQKLALIVRAADVKGQESAAPEGIGLRSIAQGFAALGISDEERLLRQFPIYDALYAFVQTK